jgi:hypothetical protein
MSVTKVSNPVISGTAKVGQVLTTSDGVWTTTSDYLTYEYQWMRVNAAGQSPIDIAGATSKNYTVQTSDLGYRLKVRVTPKEHDNAPDPNRRPVVLRVLSCVGHLPRLAIPQPRRSVTVPALSATVMVVTLRL